MKKILLSVFLISCFTILKGQNISERLISSGAWFLYLQTIEEEIDGETLVLNEYFKKSDVSSLLFDEENRLYSVFSDNEKEMNEDLWRLIDDNNLVIVSLGGETSQVMEILHFDADKLVLRYWNKLSEEVSSSVISTYLPTKLDWPTDDEIELFNTVGIVKVDEMTP